MDISESPPNPIGLFSNLEREHGFESVEVVGELPEGLEGTLYLNGGGIFEQFGKRYDHIFESDGAITAVRISGGKACTSSRIVQSTGLIEERKRGKHLGSFAAKWPTRFYRMLFGGRKNTSNTHIVPWQKNLYALNEASRPVRINSETLETIGETDLDGVITSSFSAHPHRVDSRECLFNFGMTYGKETFITVYILPDIGPAKTLCKVSIAHPVMLHDFTVTENHIVFFIPPARVKIWRMMLALKPFQDNIAWKPGFGTEVIIIPIDSPSNIIRFHTSPFMQFHFAGAFENEGEISVDYIWYKNSSLLGALGDGMNVSWSDLDSQVHGKLHRANIDIDGRALVTEPLWDGNSEYPQISTKDENGKYQHTWMQTSEEVDGQLRFSISRLDANQMISHHKLEAGQICLEPVLATGDGRSFVMSMVFDSYTQKSNLIILDAETLLLEAKIIMSQTIPLTFHGSWVDSSNGCH